MYIAIMGSLTLEIVCNPIILVEYIYNNNKNNEIAKMCKFTIKSHTTPSVFHFKRFGFFFFFFFVYDNTFYPIQNFKPFIS
jgi:hypothetical protein